jgi:hypothetical protein
MEKQNDLAVTGRDDMGNIEDPKEMSCGIEKI